jgi:hypothetical protein
MWWGWVPDDMPMDVGGDGVDLQWHGLPKGKKGAECVNARGFRAD